MNKPTYPVIGDFYLHLNVGTTFAQAVNDDDLGVTPYNYDGNEFLQCDGAYGLHAFLCETLERDGVDLCTNEGEDLLDTRIDNVITIALERVRRGDAFGTFAADGVDYFFAVCIGDRYGDNLDFPDGI